MISSDLVRVHRALLRTCAAFCESNDGHVIKGYVALTEAMCVFVSLPFVSTTACVCVGPQSYKLLYKYERAKEMCTAQLLELALILYNGELY